MTIAYKTSPAIQPGSPPNTPPLLHWSRQAPDLKNFKITNTGTEAFRVRIAGQVSPPPTNDFDWGGVDAILDPAPAPNLDGQTQVLDIDAPRFGTGTQTTDIPFEIVNMTTGQVVPPGPLTPGFVRCVMEDVSVGYGDLFIAAMNFNPPGKDTDDAGGPAADDGEFLDIKNFTARNLDLTGCTITQMTFNKAGVGTEQELVTFAPNPTRLDFGATCLLPAGATLRVLTRGRRNGEGPGAAGTNNTSLKYFLERSVGVWNNSGDRATIYNSLTIGAPTDFTKRQRVASFGYGSQRNAPNDPTAPWPQPVVTGGGGGLTTVFGPQVIPVAANDEAGTEVSFNLQDGDVVTLDANDAGLIANWVNNGIDGPGTIVLQTLFGIRLFPSGSGEGIIPRRPLPANLAPSDALVPGGPQGALVFRVRDSQGGGGMNWTMNAGSTTPFSVTLNGTGRLILAVNDSTGTDIFGNSFFADNSGSFLVTVTVQR